MLNEATDSSYLARFADARLGMFLHFGLYSVLGRGEWAMNREAIPVDEYKKLAEQFQPDDFDADDLVGRAKRAGCRYLTFTTMHHEGFALYDSKINPFNSVNLGPKRDLVAEVVEACRKHDMGVHLYHSLNQWITPDGVPDAVEALENESAHEAFIEFTFDRIRELLTLFNPIDCLWYDGWWPFNAQGWKAKEMNAMAKSIQPHLIFNGRNCLPGDFATPEQHLSAPTPHRPWEACLTHGSTWSYTPHDNLYKSTAEVLSLVTQAATGAGNLLLNFGPDPSGRLPQPSYDLLDELAPWMDLHGESIYASEPLAFGPLIHDPATERGDWLHLGKYTAKGNTLYLHLHNWPGTTFSFADLQCKALDARLMTTDSPVTFEQDAGRVTFTGLPANPPHPQGGVIALTCDQKPAIYRCGGLRTPNVAHPRYDPVEPDLVY